MTSAIIFSLSLCSVFLFPLMSQPLSLGLTIMLSTMFLCMTTAIFLSSWYGYILFLIYVGGLLVMFAYVATLSPNVLFGGANPLFFFLGAQTFLPLVIFFSFFSDLAGLTPAWNTQESLMALKMYGAELVSPFFISVLIGLAMILLINLIVVVKICYYQHATLRPYKVD
uniref:NADH dehydrogenase subunit 6 n=1 Tax=Turritella bacillum TaxID=1088899 RepID=A0A140GAZ3_9CAEN|nr:NADH dehydrogenase subunit 6 [Turritella bacillum]AMM72628.1 NADH dehydrogenase subunit 6 [Turritella bacillum]